MEGFSCYGFGGLIFGGAYTWRGLFSEFYGIKYTHFVTFQSVNETGTSDFYNKISSAVLCYDTTDSAF